AKDFMKKCAYCGLENSDESVECVTCHTPLGWQFPMPMTIRCYQCGKVYEAVLTSEEPHEFPCPACGKVEVYDLGAMKEKAMAFMRKRIRKSSGGRQT